MTAAAIIAIAVMCILSVSAQTQPSFTKPSGSMPPRPTGGSMPPRPSDFTKDPSGTNPPRPSDFTKPPHSMDPSGSMPPRPTGDTKPPRPSDFTKDPSGTNPPRPTGDFTKPPRPTDTQPPRPTFPPFTRPPKPTEPTRPPTPAPTPKICNMSHCSGRGTNTLNATTGKCDCVCNGLWVGRNCEWCPTKYAQDGTCSTCATDRINFPACDPDKAGFATKCTAKCATAGCGNSTVILSNGVMACQCGGCKPAPRACSAANLTLPCSYPVSGKCLSLLGKMKCVVGAKLVDCVEKGCV